MKPDDPVVSDEEADSIIRRIYKVKRGAHDHERALIRAAVKRGLAIGIGELEEIGPHIHVKDDGFAPLDNPLHCHTCASINILRALTERVGKEGRS